MVPITIPDDLLPRDGRFGSGPSKVRNEVLSAIVKRSALLGTSHRQEPVRALVRAVREQMASLFGLPEGYEVVLGNGGAAAFWDLATFSLIDERSQHLVFGEFSRSFADIATAASHLGEPERRSSELGTHPEAVASNDVDVYALTHNETSTGVSMPPKRPRREDGTLAEGLVVVDGTSAAGALRFDPLEVDTYYFSPQKVFGAEAGLWVALCSPAAIARAEQLAATRFVPAFLDLRIAIEQSRLDQTYNTPSILTLLLLNEQLDWFLERGGLEFAASRSDRSAEVLYGWAERSAYARPFVDKPDERSHVVATIDFSDEVDAARVAGVLRANGIVDTEPYRKLGRNQLRVALYPNVEVEDVAALTTCIDYVIERLA